MKPRIWNFIPYCYSDTGKGKDLALMYRKYMDLIPDNDWAIFMDHDIYLTYKKWYRICERAIEKYPEAGMFTCKVTRHTRAGRNIWKLQKGLQPCFDLRELIKAGNQVAMEKQDSITEVTTLEMRNKGMPTTGYFMLIRKGAWKVIVDKIPQHARGDVDFAIHNELEKAGFKIYIMDGLLVFHYAKG